MKKQTIQLLSCLIPVRKWRKNFRKHFNKKEKQCYNTEIKLLELLLSEKYEKFFGISDDELISNDKHHIKTDGIKIIRPEIEYVARLIMNREKDKQISALMEIFTKFNPNILDEDFIKQLKIRAGFHD